jgi:hypothetical protein
MLDAGKSEPGQPAASDAEGEIASRSRHVAVAIFAMTAAFFLTKTGRDALFFQKRGLFDLPMAYMGMAVLSVPFAFGMLGAMRRLGSRRTRIVAPLTMAGVLFVAHALARPGGGPLMTAFFMLVPLAFGVLFSLFWLLAADLLDGSPREAIGRSYGLVGASSIAGGMAAGLFAELVARWVEPREFLRLGAIGLVIAAAVVGRTQARFPARILSPPAPGSRPDASALWAVLGKPYTLILLGTGMLASLVGMLVDFQFYLAAATSGHDGRENARFFGSVYLFLNGAGLALQLWLMPRLQRAVGVHGSLLVLPAALLGGAAALLATAILATATFAAPALLRITEGGLRTSIHRANWEQAFLPVERAQRAAAKLLVDGAAARVAEGLAALLMLVWLHIAVAEGDLLGRDTSFFAYLLVGSSLAWVVVTRVLGRRLAASGVASDAAEQRLDIPLPDT